MSEEVLETYPVSLFSGLNQVKHCATHGVYDMKLPGISSMTPFNGANMSFIAPLNVIKLDPASNPLDGAHVVAAGLGAAAARVAAARVAT